MKPTLFLFSLFFFLNCSEKTSEKNTQKSSLDTKQVVESLAKQPLPPPCDSLAEFQTITVAGHQVDIARPKGQSIGNLLILQGFAFPKDDWCKKSSLCKKALAAGYTLIMPEMRKSNYMSQLYPQTRADWKKEPQKHWLTDSLFSFLQNKYCLLLPTQNNFIVGLSTGARGVAVVALEKPELFRAAAALSGDYEQSKIPQDRVHIGYMGSYQQYPKRWREEENIVFQIKRWKTPIYIGHGKLDKVCPYQQSQLFYEALVKHHPELRVKLNLPAQYAHDYRYWDYEVDNILAFFEGKN
jgi:dienelactone hydrolase